MRRLAGAVWSLVRRRWLLTSALAVGLAAYAAAGFWYAPRLLQQKAQQWVRDNYHRELAMGAVHVNPFRLRLELADVALPDADGQTMLGFRRLLVDFEVASLWRRALVFREVELEAPVFRLVRRAEGRINLADLALPATEPAPAEPEPLPRVWIRRLAVASGRAQYLDAARTTPLAREYSPITFGLTDFRTTAEGGRFELAARSASGEAFEWNGQFALAPAMRSTGQIRLTQLGLAGLWEFLPETLPAVLRSGTLSLQGRYAFTLNDEPDFQLDLPQVEITAAALGPRSSDETWLAAQRILLETVAVDSTKRSVEAARLGITGLDARASLGADGKLNLTQLWEEPAKTDSTPVSKRDAVPASSPAPAAAAKPWRVRVAATAVEAVVDLEDRRGKTVQHLRLAPLNVATGPVSSDLSQPLAVNLDAKLNEQASLKLSGQLTPAPLAASLQIQLAELPLALLKHYALPQAALTVNAGTLATSGQLAITSKTDAAMGVSYEGDVQMAGLRSVDNLLRQDFINFRSLKLQKLRFSSQPAQLAIARVVVQEPYARLVISPEQVLNVSAVLDPEAAAKQPKSAPPPKKQNRGANRRAAQAPKPAAAEQPETLPVRIGTIEMQRGRLSFTDLNIRPNFAAEIRDLSGSVAPVSSARDARATVKLAGNLGEFSPVKIEGSLQPFAFDRFTDIRLSFTNMALPVFNPYSGVFAGFNIAKGRLDTELSYEIADRKLKAGHHVRIDQLEWGEASEFKGEATLPVKFATALLRDRHGVIELDLPVTGSLDDPKLRIGPLVWQVLRNVIVKAATAPFALLGSLFGGAEEAQEVRFAAGSAVLDETMAKNLAALAKGLAERDGISLDVPLAVVPEIDRAALIEQSVQAGLQSARSAGMGDTALAALETQLRASSAVSDGDLERLAQARSEAVQRALLASGELPVSRVFIVRDGKVSADGGTIKLQLALK